MLLRHLNAFTSQSARANKDMRVALSCCINLFVCVFALGTHQKDICALKYFQITLLPSSFSWNFLCSGCLLHELRRLWCCSNLELIFAVELVWVKIRKVDGAVSLMMHHDLKKTERGQTWSRSRPSSSTSLRTLLESRLSASVSMNSFMLNMLRI